MLGKPCIKGMLTFDILSLKSSMIFHRCYHYSVALQLNHLLFLNLYVLGVLMIAASFGGWSSVCTIMAIYASYAVYLARLQALPYLCLVGLLAVYATELAARSGSQQSYNWEAALTGLWIVFGSFLAQLAGHALFEEFAAPPHLFHGFVAAPLLEFVSLLFTLGFLPALREAVDLEVERERGAASPP